MTVDIWIVVIIAGVALFLGIWIGKSTERMALETERQAAEVLVQKEMAGEKEDAADEKHSPGETVPVDAIGRQLVKAMIARNLEKMEQLGAYEVAPEDFALCEFVCTSKIETQRIVREALNYMRKELE